MVSPVKRVIEVMKKDGMYRPVDIACDLRMDLEQVKTIFSLLEKHGSIIKDKGYYRRS